MKRNRKSFDALLDAYIDAKMGKGTITPLPPAPSSATYEDFKKRYDLATYLLPDQVMILDQYVAKFIPRSSWTSREYSEEPWIFDSLDEMIGERSYLRGFVFELLFQCCETRLNKTVVDKAQRKILLKSLKAVEFLSSETSDSKYDPDAARMVGMSGLEYKKFHSQLERLRQALAYAVRMSDPRGDKSNTIYYPQAKQEIKLSARDPEAIFNFVRCVLFMIFVERAALTGVPRLPRKARIALAHFLLFWKIIEEPKNEADPVGTVAERLRYVFKIAIKLFKQFNNNWPSPSFVFGPPRGMLKFSLRDIQIDEHGRLVHHLPFSRSRQNRKKVLKKR